MEIENLLEKGYFPEELIEVFSSKGLLAVLGQILPKIDQLDPLSGKRPTSKCTQFSIPKIKNNRRTISIPNPLHYIRLCKTITENWATLSGHCNRSEISVSRLEYNPDSQRALIKPNFDNYIQERIKRSTGSRYLLRIDIARCYHSIYTHSIPWALHTKQIAKKNRSRTLLGNMLDADLRQLQDGQTIGIPVGPDTSRIISEVILCTIDDILINSFKNFRGIRIVDDYYLYFKNIGEVEVARAILQRALKDFELELNPKKEKVLEVPEIIESEWYYVIREFRFDNAIEKQKKDLIAFFDKAIFYAKKFPDEFVLTYAMAKLRATIIHSDNWPLSQSLMLNCLNIEPKILPFIAQILIGYTNINYTIDENILKPTLEDFLLFHIPLNNDFEIIWTLWIVKALKLEVSERVAKELSLLNSPLVILTVLDLFHADLIPDGLSVNNWLQYLTAENLYTEYWILAYEAVKKGWLTIPKNYIEDDPFFNILFENDVEFYLSDTDIDLSNLKIATEQYSLGELTGLANVENRQREYEADFDLEDLDF